MAPLTKEHRAAARRLRETGAVPEKTRQGEGFGAVAFQTDRARPEYATAIIETRDEPVLVQAVRR